MLGARHTRARPAVLREGCRRPRRGCSPKAGRRDNASRHALREAAAVDRQKVTREELFVMVWERPATEVARELGLSDVGLASVRIQ